METIIKKALEKIKACPVVKVEFEANKITVKGISPDKMEIKLVVYAFLSMLDFTMSVNIDAFVESKKAFGGFTLLQRDYKELSEELKQMSWDARELQQFDEATAYDFLNS